MAIFPDVDHFRIARNLHLEALGNQNGRKDAPATGDTVRDEAHQQIENTMTEIFDQGRTAAKEEAQRLESLRNEIDLRPVEAIINTIKVNIEKTVGRVMHERRKELIALRREERAMLRDLRYFVESNKIHHEPHYPESNIFHISIIIGLVVLESLLNSYFFSKGSDLGLLGGTLQAMIISIANVGLSVLAGIYVIRNLYHVNVSNKVIAASGLVAYIAVIFLFNLATAHYRAQLEIAPIEALNRTIPSMRRGLFWIDNFDAWVLFGIGLISSAVALADGFLADDRYPNYGKIDRRYRATHQAYEAAKQSLQNAINAAVDEGQAELNARVDQARRDCNEFRRLLTRSKGIQDEYEAFAESVEECYRTLQSTYRTANRKVRSSLAPTYFEDYGRLCDHPPLPVGDLVAAEAKASRLEETLINIDRLAETQHAQFRAINDQALNAAAAFLKDVEAEADSSSGDDNRFSSGSKA